MLIFIAWDGDHIGRQVGRASLNNDIEGLRRISQSIEHGNEIWTSWVNASLGEMISAGGDEGRASVPPEHLDEIEEIRKKYAEAVGSPVSVGVGLKLSEADKALLAAKINGGDRVQFYTPECEETLKGANEHPKTEYEKISDEYLGKTAVAMNQGAFTGAHHPEAPAKPQAAAGGQGEHSQAHAMYDLLEQSRPPAPELTHAAQDYEEQFHQEATKQAQSDQQAALQSQSNIVQLKQQVVSTLQGIKQMAPMLSQLQQGAPEVYQSVMQMTQIMIGLARELVGQQPQGQPQQSAAPTQPLGKVALSPGGHHHQILPVGSQIDGSAQGTHDNGKVKVKHLSGKTGWIHARAGQIMSQDGHAISSRNPKGN